MANATLRMVSRARAGFSYYDTWADNYVYPPNRDNTPVADLNQIAYGTTLITSGYRFNTYPDLNHRTNAGNSSAGAKGLLWSYHSKDNRLGMADASWKGKVRDYCLFNDPICQAGSGGWEEHLYYAGDTYAKQNLAIFAIDKFRGVASN